MPKQARAQYPVMNYHSILLQEVMCWSVHPDPTMSHNHNSVLAPPQKFPQSMGAEKNGLQYRPQTMVFPIGLPTIDIEGGWGGAFNMNRR